MRPTIIPIDNINPDFCGLPQMMVFYTNFGQDNSKYKYHSEPKRMHQILEEWGFLDYLTNQNGGKHPLSECRFCKSSHETQERLLHEAQAAIARGGQT